MRENVRRVNASVIPKHESACPVERQQSCQEAEREGEGSWRRGWRSSTISVGFLGRLNSRNPILSQASRFCLSRCGQGRSRWMGRALVPSHRRFRLHTRCDLHSLAAIKRPADFTLSNTSRRLHCKTSNRD